MELGVWRQTQELQRMILRWQKWTVIKEQTSCSQLRQGLWSNDCSLPLIALFFNRMLYFSSYYLNESKILFPPIKKGQLHWSELWLKKRKKGFWNQKPFFYLNSTTYQFYKLEKHLKYLSFSCLLKGEWRVLSCYLNFHHFFSTSWDLRTNVNALVIDKSQQWILVTHLTLTYFRMTEEI